MNILKSILLILVGITLVGCSQESVEPEVVTNSEEIVAETTVSSPIDKNDPKGTIEYLRDYLILEEPIKSSFEDWWEMGQMEMYKVGRTMTVVLDNDGYIAEIFLSSLNKREASEILKEVNMGNVLEFEEILEEDIDVTINDRVIRHLEIKEESAVQIGTNISDNVDQGIDKPFRLHILYDEGLIEYYKENNIL